MPRFPFHVIPSSYGTCLHVDRPNEKAPPGLEARTFHPVIFNSINLFQNVGDSGKSAGQSVSLPVEAGRKSMSVESILAAIYTTIEHNRGLFPSLISIECDNRNLQHPQSEAANDEQVMNYS